MSEKDSGEGLNIFTIFNIFSRKGLTIVNDYVIVLTTGNESAHISCNMLTKVNNMFIEERHQAILDLLNEKGSITTTEIQENFSVSYDSAKRDLRILEEKGLLKRTHGGAIKLRQVAFSKPPKMTCKDIGEIKDNYLAIAKAAVSMIKNNDVIKEKTKKCA